MFLKKKQRTLMLKHAEDRLSQLMLHVVNLFTPGGEGGQSVGTSGSNTACAVNSRSGFRQDTASTSPAIWGE